MTTVKIYDGLIPDMKREGFALEQMGKIALVVIMYGNMRGLVPLPMVSYLSKATL